MIKLYRKRDMIGIIEGHLRTVSRPIDANPRAELKGRASKKQDVCNGNHKTLEKLKVLQSNRVI